MSIHLTAFGGPLHLSSWTRAPWSSAWPNFSPREVACGQGGGCRFCGGSLVVDPEFMGRLQYVRWRLGRPVVITSAHRCVGRNASVGGAARSHHTVVYGDPNHRGVAVDVLARDAMEKVTLHAAAREAGFTGFGFYASWLHLDLGPPRHWEDTPGELEQWI